MMGEGRQRLRPWLERILTEGSIPGVQWIDSDRKKFKIPWKHGGKQDWSADDGQIFKAWALHTGKFREGMDTEDYALWKTRLRCAFNKAPDIEQLKEEGRVQSTEDRPCRVYRFRAKKDLKRKAPASPKPSPAYSSPEAEDQAHSNEAAMAQDEGNAAGPVIPATVEDLKSYDSGKNENSLSQIDSKGLLGTIGSLDLNEMPSISMTSLDKLINGAAMADPDQEVLPVTTAQLEAIELMSSTHMACSRILPNVNVMATHPVPYQVVPPSPIPQVMQQQGTAEMGEMTVKLCCSNEEHKKVIVPSNPGCFRIWHDSSQGFKETHAKTSVFNQLVCVPAHQLLYGPEDAIKIEYDNIEGHYKEKPGCLSTARQILENLSRGVVVRCENGNLIAHRHCLAKVYHLSDLHTSGQPACLNRNQETTVFDFEGDFMNQCELYRSRKIHDLPDTRVHLHFGQEVPLSKVNEKLCLSAVVVSTKAEIYVEELRRERERDGDLMSIKVSLPDQLDEMEKEIANTKPQITYDNGVLTLLTSNNHGIQELPEWSMMDTDCGPISVAANETVTGDSDLPGIENLKIRTSSESSGSPSSVSGVESPLSDISN